MDEAERCHKLAYIAYGRLMAQGTAEEIIASQKLTTWEVSGTELTAVAERLRRRPGVEQVAAFGSTLHVTGRDPASLEAALREAVSGTDCRAQPAATGLEDVFIHLTEQSVDNFGPKS
jgi:ABC-2 type transport system ATP-binding protein